MPKGKVFRPEVWAAVERCAHDHRALSYRMYAEMLCVLMPGQRVPGKTQIRTHLLGLGPRLRQPKAPPKMIAVDKIRAVPTADSEILALLRAVLSSPAPCVLLGGFFVRPTRRRPRFRVQYLLEFEKEEGAGRRRIKQAAGHLALDLSSDSTLDLVAFLRRVGSSLAACQTPTIRLFLARSWRNGPFRPLTGRSKLPAELSPLPCKIRWISERFVAGACESLDDALREILFNGVGVGTGESLSDSDLRLLGKARLAAVPLGFGAVSFSWTLAGGTSCEPAK
jgi:hypothetical protein